MPVGRIRGNNDWYNYPLIIHPVLGARSSARGAGNPQHEPDLLLCRMWSLGGDQEPQHLLRGRWVRPVRAMRLDRCPPLSGLTVAPWWGADTSQLPLLVVLWQPGRGNQSCAGRGLAGKPIQPGSPLSPGAAAGWTSTFSPARFNPRKNTADAEDLLYQQKGLFVLIPRTSMGQQRCQTASYGDNSFWCSGILLDEFGLRFSAQKTSLN